MDQKSQLVGGEAESRKYFTISKNRNQMSGDQIRAKETTKLNQKGENNEDSSMVGYQGIISNENATTRLEEPFAATARDNENWLNPKMDDTHRGSASASRPTPITDTKTPNTTAMGMHIVRVKDDQSTNLDFAAGVASEDASFVNP